MPGLLNGYLQYFRWQYLHFGLQLLGQPDPAYAVPTFADACQVQAAQAEQESLRRTSTPSTEPARLMMQAAVRVLPERPPAHPSLAPSVADLP